MRRPFPAVLCLFLLLALGCTPQPRTENVLDPADPQRPRFIVATYNVNFGMPRPDLALAAMRSTGADVLCLQETTEQWMDYLKPALRDQYPHVLARQWSGAGGLAFFSKVPLDEVEFIRPQAGWFPAWIVNARTPLARVQIMSVHLHPQLNEQGSVSLGAYANTPKTRRQEIEQFHARLRQNLPTIILGDFNENDAGQAVAWLKTKGFSDALSRVDTSTPTWQWQSSIITLHGRFDHVMYSDRLRCLDASVLKQGASDHLPVVAVFEVN